MLRKMNETEMVRFLKDMGVMEHHIKRELNQLQNQVETIEGAIERRNYPSLDYSDVRVQQDMDTDRTLQVLLDARADVDRELRNLELRKQELYQKEDQMHLVRRCLSRLPYDAQDILICSFIKGEGWRVYIRRKCICQSYYYKLRRDAVSDLCEIYNQEVDQMTFWAYSRRPARRKTTSFSNPYPAWPVTEPENMVYSHSQPEYYVAEPEMFFAGKEAKLEKYFAGQDTKDEKDFGELDAKDEKDFAERDARDENVYAESDVNPDISGAEQSLDSESFFTEQGGEQDDH